MNVLIIGAKQPYDISGTNTTIRNLFGFLNIDELRYVSFSDMPERQGYELNVSHFLIADLLAIIFHNKNKNKRVEASLSSNGYIAKTGVRSLILAIEDIFPIKITKQQYKLFDDFKPDFIYTYGTNITNFKIAAILARKFDINVCVHIMDNWYDTTYIQKGFGFFRKILKRSMQSTLKHGKEHFTISKPLSQRMKKDFPEYQWSEIINPAKKLDFNAPLKEKGKCKILYAGGITLNRWKSLLDFNEIIKEISFDKGNIDVCFDAYIPPKLIDSVVAQKMRVSGIHVYRYVPEEQIYDLYKKYDVLLLTESFDSDLVTFLEFSFSTKVPEYLAANRVVLAYMPEKLYTIQFFQEQSFGVVCRNKTELRNKLYQVIMSDDCKKFLQGQLECVEKEYSLDAVSKKMMKVCLDSNQ